MASLRDLGLSEYESRTYRALLETGPTTAKELSDASDVPMGRIYDVLNGLEDRDLVRCQTASHPKRYAAVEPDTALDRLLAERKRELTERAEQYEEIADDLGERLTATGPADEPFWTAAVGPQEVADLLIERLSTAEERIVIVSRTPTARVDLDRVGERVADELERALDRGVSVSVLLRPEVVDALPSSVDRRYRRLREHETFSVRLSEGVTGTFELIDSAEVCIEVPHPLEVDGSFAVIALRDREFATRTWEALRPHWENARSPEP